MRATFATLALAAMAAATPAPSGAPSSSAPSGCSSSYSGSFEIELVNLTTTDKRSIAKRDVLQLSLSNGVLTDAKGRIGSIVANGQFQFDGPPPQAGAIYTSGWALCPNNTLTLGAETVFWQCLTSTYYNIYDMSVGGQCSPVHIQAINGGYAAASQASDGQPQASPVTQYTDGQPQAPTGKPVSQISDGQPQGPTGKPVSQISDGQPQAPTGKPVSQISDGQPQAPTGSPVSQISDGQPQGPTGAPVSQISDGQPQAPTATPSRTGSPVSQISDGQPQAPAGTGVIPKPANGTTLATGATRTPTASASSTPVAATGAAVANVVSAASIFAGAIALALL